MKTGAFITVRSDSSRLPRKAFLEILGKPVIEHIISRAKLIRGIDEVVVCTSDRAVDDGLAEIAARKGVRCFRGSLEDKMERWLGAAKTFGIDYFVTFDGDDLFCDPELCEMGIEQAMREEFDMMRAPDGLICGSFTFCIKVAALEYVCRRKNTTDTEFMWVFFEKNKDFKLGELKVEDKIFYSDTIRLTLDYIEDFNFFRAVMEHFNRPDNDVPLRVIAQYLNEHPEIPRINYFRQQDYLNNQKNKISQILPSI